MRSFMKSYSKFQTKPILALLCLGVAACSSLPAAKGNLSRYDQLESPHGILAKYSSHVDHVALNRFSKVYIHPVTIAPEALSAASTGQKSARLDLVSNLISRTLCEGMSKAYIISDKPGPDTWELKVFITQFAPTGLASAVSALTMVRPPVGLGKLSAEAESVSPDGSQLAAMMWSRQASVVFSGGGLSPISDAYEFAGDFAHDFNTLVIKNAIATQKQKDVTKDKSDVCSAYGKAAQAKGFLFGLSPIGSAPEWSDDGQNPADKPK